MSFSLRSRPEFFTDTVKSLLAGKTTSIEITIQQRQQGKLGEWKINKNPDTAKQYNPVIWSKTQETLKFSSRNGKPKVKNGDYLIVVLKF